MSDLAEFLLARIAEDEETAYPGCSWFTDRRYGLLDTGEYVSIFVADPEFVLAECEAKRRIIEHHARMPDPEGESAADLCAICSANGPHAQGWPCETLRLLALPYADHPDYREEWRP